MEFHTKIIIFCSAISFLVILDNKLSAEAATIGLHRDKEPELDLPSSVNDDINREDDVDLSEETIDVHRIKRKAPKKSRKGSKKRCKKSVHVVIDKTHKLARPIKTGIDGSPIQSWGVFQSFVKCFEKYFVADNNMHQANTLLKDRGTITIVYPALYLVYSRITIIGTPDSMSFYEIKIDDQSFLTCWKTDALLSPLEVGDDTSYKTHCYTSGVIYLTAGQNVSITSTRQNLELVNGDQDTYFGIKKLT